LRHALLSTVLGCFPKFLEAFSGLVLDFLALGLGQAFHFTEALFELAVGTLQGDVGVEAAVTGHIHQAEHDVAEFIFQAVDVLVVGRDFFHFRAELRKFFLSLVEYGPCLTPIKADPSHTADDVLGAGQRGHALADFIHDGIASVFQVVLFLSLDFVPTAGNIRGGIDLSVPKNVRVPTDHLFANAVHHVINAEIPVILCHLGMENHLEKHIPQFFAHMFLVIFLHRIDILTGLFHKVGQKGLVGLLTIPRATVLGAESRHNISKVFKGITHMTQDRKDKCSTGVQNQRIDEDHMPLSLGASIFKPTELYCAGRLPEEDFVGIAMVGTRRPSTSAAELCRRLIFSLKGTKAVIVSGLAQGIDSLCHEAALEAGLPTIAVLAQGLHTRIEGSRGDLAKRILEAGGALVSQFQADTPAYKGNFIARNKIISGMSQATVVIQSKEKGGALVTAEFCRQEGKKLYAVPGDFDSEVSSGTNLLLDSGVAQPVFRPESFCQVLGLPKQGGESLEHLSTIGCNLTADTLAFFKKVNGFKKTFSELQAEFDFNTNQLLTILTELEIAGLAHTEDNFQFYFNGAA